MIKMLVFDIDGVITDGKKYIDGKQTELKTVQFRDLDAIGELSRSGFALGCISGEDTDYSRQFQSIKELKHVKLGCKDKLSALYEISKESGAALKDIAYVGDGKYDIPVLQAAGLGICPKDAIREAKAVADMILECRGGEGCLAEIFTVLMRQKHLEDRTHLSDAVGIQHLKNRIIEHDEVVKCILNSEEYCCKTMQAIDMIVESYRDHGHLFLCGNGGSAADAQHLAAEMVGRFYLERKAWSAEALTTNTSIITALANDYDYNTIFARQLEAKGAKGDVLIGITTSGGSRNIYEAFVKAKQMGVGTILMTGAISEYSDILEYTDILLDVPSKDTPRIQEMHIMTGHLMCEMIEQALI